MIAIFHIKNNYDCISISDASELGSARFGSYLAQAGGFSARLGSARKILGLARLVRFGQYGLKFAYTNDNSNSDLV